MDQFSGDHPQVVHLGEQELWHTACDEYHEARGTTIIMSIMELKMVHHPEYHEA